MAAWWHEIFSSSVESYVTRSMSLLVTCFSRREEKLITYLQAAMFVFLFHKHQWINKQFKLNMFHFFGGGGGGGGVEVGEVRKARFIMQS